MPYHTTCFSCHKSLMMRESILVKAALSREILHRYHPACYAQLTEWLAQTRLEYTQTLEVMRNATLDSFPSTRPPDKIPANDVD